MGDDELVALTRDDLQPVRPDVVRRLLGRAYDAVVLDLGQGVDADLLGQCHGFVRGGGALVLRMPDEAPLAGRERHAVYPFAPFDVGTRFWQRLTARLAHVEASPPSTLAPARRETQGSSDQATAVRVLRTLFGRSVPQLAVLLSDRGRGKSSALGIAIRDLERPAKVAVTAAHESSTHEIFRFATGDASPALRSADTRFIPPEHLALASGGFDVIVIDEAAQLSVPLLRRIVSMNPGAHIAFASTVRGYEGTGRGFVLRFLEWLRHEPRPLTHLSLDTPIRWDPGDTLERWMFDLLLLDAEPASLGDRPCDETRHVVLDRDALARDDTLLREVFGLLVHAHYRTTPGDLQRLLDAPNLDAHALLQRDRVVAATLVAREGELPRDLIQRVALGRERLRGHALADTLVCHAGHLEAGEMAIVRSVRVAVHPERRRRGFGTRLIEAVHAHYRPDFFGTIFGATDELLRFRRSVGYELVRIGSSRGARTGEPAAVMMRPVSERAKRLQVALREQLARDLPLQLELLEQDGGLLIEPALRAGLLRDLGEPPPLDERDRSYGVASYAFGPRTFESAVVSITEWLRLHTPHIAALDRTGRILIESRVFDRAPWAEVTRAASMPSVPAAMRALRRAVRAVVTGVEPDREARFVKELFSSDGE